MLRGAASGLKVTSCVLITRHPLTPGRKHRRMGTLLPPGWAPISTRIKMLSVSLVQTVNGWNRKKDSAKVELQEIEMKIKT